MKFAIVGYGNLGKSLEREIENSKVHELTAIYSRRRLDNKKYIPFEEIDKGDFDVALVALGSYADVEHHMEKLRNFHTVDSFDTHAKINVYKQTLNDLKPNKISIISAGWDPGLLSLCRATLGICAKTAATVWGKGVSQGHSNAVRQIKGVIDAVQFTVPKKDYLTLVSNGITAVEKLHDRICYVACVENDKRDVERQIKSMPNYFDGYDTTVRFTSPVRVRELKKQTAHKGRVVCLGDGFKAEAQICMESNADYTAKIMLAYALTIPKLQQDGFCGALDVFDIPLKYIADAKII